MMRKAYEYVMIYSFLLVPLCVVGLYLFFYYQLQIDWFSIFDERLNEGLLLTLCLFYFKSAEDVLRSLPENNYRRLMRRYRHDMIMHGGFFIGYFAIGIGILCYVVQVPQLLLNLFVLFVTTTALYNFRWIYHAYKNTHLADEQ